MKLWKSKTLDAVPYIALALLAPAAFAHEGHGVPGSVGHALQHQLWTFAVLVAMGAILMTGDQLYAVIRERLRSKRKDRDS
jgi:thiamine pyrophosphate-dependent acetolactate synthase large subunit-like protein